MRTAVEESWQAIRESSIEPRNGSWHGMKYTSVATTVGNATCPILKVEKSRRVIFKIMFDEPGEIIGNS